MNAPAPVTGPPEVTLARVLRLWWPLAGSWVLMGIELPLFSAFVARMADPKLHLAAFSSLVSPVALLIEGPIMMLLVAGTALSRDLASYRKLKRFMMASGAALTLVHVLVAFTPLFDVVADWMDARPEVRGPGRLGLQIMTPWTWAIAHRRFHQGVLIRFGRSGEVWIGTLLRLVANAAVLSAGLAAGGLPGIAVGATGITTGVVAEMLYIAWRASDVVRGPLATAPEVEPLRRRRFLAFYAPLAVSPVLMLIVQPMAAAAMNRMPVSLDSLASWSPVWGLVFMTRSVGIAYNEVVVALLGEPGAVLALRRFALLLGATTMGILILLAATPLAELWFRRASGLKPELVELCRHAVAFAVIMPGYQALQSWYQGALVHEHRTRAVTEAVVVYLGVAVALLVVSVRIAEHPGIYYAILCFSAAGLAQTIWLWARSRRSLRARSSAAAAEAIAT